jgi:hypothetical protein
VPPERARPPNFEAKPFWEGKVMANGEMLICEARVKSYILRRAAEMRKGWTCKRVSKEAVEDINTNLRLTIDKMIQAHPTLGVTFKTRSTRRK